MTENEAIKFIGQAVIESGKALESLQSIKSEAERIGKVGEYYANLNNCIKEIEACRVAIIAIEEIQLYRATGTVEEFKALKEKNEPKKPINYDKHYYKCPICNRDIGIDDDSLYVYGEEPPHFCQNCGTEFDWS